MAAEAEFFRARIADRPFAGRVGEMENGDAAVLRQIDEALRVRAALLLRPVARRPAHTPARHKLTVCVRARAHSQTCREAGIQNILALRGGTLRCARAEGRAAAVSHPASTLPSLRPAARAGALDNYGDYFGIGVAGKADGAWVGRFVAGARSRATGQGDRTPTGPEPVFCSPAFGPGPTRPGRCSFGRLSWALS